MEILDRLKLLETENARLRKENQALREQLRLLLQQIERSQVKKDSHNSHNPPSQDKSNPPRTKSRREKSNRKPGGQKGHKGHHLKMSDTPDKVIDLKSHYCNACGNDLQDVPADLLSKRQVIELPPIRPIYEEYRQYGCTCPKCGNNQVADYPAGVNAPIQYGSSVESYLAYFSVYQYVPYQRLKHLFFHTFNLPISEGSIQNLLQRASLKAGVVYEHIREQLKKAAYLGGDETGAKVNSERWWIWVWQNALNTYLHASDNRGSATIEACFPEGFANATIGSDRWAAQLKTAAANHQLCMAHLERDLIFLEESEKHPWATHFKKLLKDALGLRAQADQQQYPFQKGEKSAWRLEDRLNRLLARPIVKDRYPQTTKFQRSMIRYRNYLFPFLYDLRIPPDNNGSERAIRNIKVKQKISGQFKTGQHDFCVLRSVIDTLIKRNLDVFTYLSKIMALQAS
ncbi:MAG: hypothetical protein CV087_21395 [Candidatus Brocadia sp. WS118]|nr:MAG: hypothetical protein CV087_21395 [Candidatus Brocadia sp. WS118]